MPDVTNAAVARAPHPSGKHVSATLVLPAMAFLAVAVHFNGFAIRGLEARFYRNNDDDSKGEALGPVLTTDGDGIARLPRLVPIGHYYCEIEHQPATIVPTVHNIDGAFPLALPIGRHVVEYDNGLDLGRDDGKS